MSIRAPDDIYLNLALRAYDSGDYDRCVDLLKGCSAEERDFHKEQFADAHYRVGVSLSAGDQFGASHEHFREAMTLSDDRSLRRICQARLELVNAIGSGGAGKLPDWLSAYGGDWVESHSVV